MPKNKPIIYLLKPNYIRSPKGILSQPHFEASVRMRLTLPKGGNLESSGIPATLELDCKGQNTSPWGCSSHMFSSIMASQKT